MKETIEIAMLQHAVKKGNVMGYIKSSKQLDRVGCLTMNNAFSYMYMGVMLNNVHANKK